MGDANHESVGLRSRHEAMETSNAAVVTRYLSMSRVAYLAGFRRLQQLPLVFTILRAVSYILVLTWHPLVEGPEFSGPNVPMAITAATKSKNPVCSQATPDIQCLFQRFKTVYVHHLFPFHTETPEGS
jgi:hypothetical protein